MSPETVGADGRLQDRQGVPPMGLLFRGQRTTDVALGLNWQGPVAFDEQFDPANVYNGSRFQPTVPGFYHLAAQIIVSGVAANALFEIALAKNAGGPGDVTIAKTVAGAGGQARSDGWGALACGGTVYLNGGSDYVECYYWAPAAAGQLRGAAQWKTYFEGRLGGVSGGVVPEAWHLVGDATTGLGTALGGTWVVDAVTPRFAKDPHGWVHMTGRIKSGTIGTTAFTLPVGYRPGNLVIVPAACSSGAFTLGELRINPDGTVIPNTGAASNWFSLDCPPWRAEA